MRVGFGVAGFSSPGGVQPFVGFTSGASTRMRNCGHGGLVQDLEYQVKFGPLGWLFGNVVMRRKLTSTLDAVFANLVAVAEASR